MSSASETVVRPLPRSPTKISSSISLSDRGRTEFSEARLGALAEVRNAPVPKRFLDMETNLGTSAWEYHQGIVLRPSRGRRQTDSYWLRHAIECGANHGWPADFAASSSFTSTRS